MDESAANLAAALNPVMLANLRRFTRIASALCVLGGLTVLFGWLLTIERLKRLGPGLASMKANTALCLMFLGFAIGVISRGAGAQTAASGPRLRLAGRVAAVLAASIALATLAEYVFRWNLGIDQFLFRDAQPDGHSIPGRMAPHTALCFLLLGAAVLLIPFETKRGARPAQFLGLGPAVISLAAILGYLYSAVSFYQVRSFTGMALHTAITIFLLSLAVFVSPPDRGAASLLSSQSLGGIVARRLLPAALFVPVVVGWIRLEGQKAGLYGTELGLALMVTANVITFSFVIYLSAARVHGIAFARQKAETSLAKSREAHLEMHYTFESVIDACPLPVISLDRDDKVQVWNHAAEQAFGWAPVQVRGQLNPLVPADRHSEFQAVAKSLRAGDSVSGVHSEVLTRDEERVSVVIWAAPITTGIHEFSGYVLVLQDATHPRSPGAQLQQARGNPSLP